MTTIAPRIKKILAIVEEIKAAIEEKGVTVPATTVFGDIPGLILQILTASGAIPLITDKPGAAKADISGTIYITDKPGAAGDSVTYYSEEESEDI